MYVKLLVVDIDVLIANDNAILHRIHRSFPKINQLFHFRRTQRIHMVGKDECDFQSAANHIFYEAGEPFALSDADTEILASLEITPDESVLEHVLKDIFKYGERFVRDVRVRSNWKRSGWLYGVSAASFIRRRQLMEECVKTINKTFGTNLTLLEPTTHCVSCMVDVAKEASDRWMMTMDEDGRGEWKQRMMPEQENERVKTERLQLQNERHHSHLYLFRL